MGKAKKICAPRPGKDYNSKTDGVFRAEPLILIVVPSRELAVQIFNEARRFCYRTRFRPCVVYGGAPVREQIATLANGCDLLIGTPGRLAHFIQEMPDRLSLNRVRYIVIDEADEILGQGFKENLRVIIGGGSKGPIFPWLLALWLLTSSLSSPGRRQCPHAYVFRHLPASRS